MSAIHPRETSIPARHLYLASRLPGDGDDDLSRLLAHLPGVAQLTVRSEAATLCMRASSPTCVYEAAALL